MVNSKIGLRTATFLVVANMVGTGIFTSLGYQVVDIRSTFSIMMLWLLGGVVALCGAVSYAELGSIYSRSGGEYHLLSKVYHPSIGFMAGWISATVGFAAPTALAAIAFANYLKAINPELSVSLWAAFIILLFAVIHSISINLGSLFQNILTFLKILLMICLVVTAFFIEAPQHLTLFPQQGDFGTLFSRSFAISLVYVLYAYSGWNAVIYIIGDIDNPKEIVSKALIWGTGIVLILYLLTNFVFLYVAPMELLQGKIEIGYIIGKRLFGSSGAKVIAGMISFFLISMIGAMIYLAPRITQVMGEDYPIVGFLAKKSKKGIPLNALWLQVGIILFFLFTSSFETILMYATFVLVFINVLTVAGVFIERYRGVTASYRAWGYPLSPLIFILVNGWVLAYLLFDKTKESLVGILILLIGIGLYFFNLRRDKK